MKELSKSKRGIIDQLQPVIIALVGVGLVLVVGFLIIAQLGTQAATVDADGAGSYVSCNSSACNGTREVQNAIADIPTWLPIIVITIIGALLIGLVSLFRNR